MMSLVGNKIQYEKEEYLPNNVFPKIENTS